MKLFTRYNRINSLVSIIIFLVGCVGFYFVLDYVLIRQLDESLETEQAEIKHLVKEHNTLPEIINTADQQVYFTPDATPFDGEQYKSAKSWNEQEKTMQWMRQLEFGLNVSDKFFKVTVNKSQDQKEDFLKLIVIIAAAMIALIIIATLVINRIVLKKIWLPFYQSMQAIGNYHLPGQHAIYLPVTGTEEFDLLNSTINSMVARIEQDYLSLKEFTGNAAHEMQTPLAVIAANTEALVQDDSLLQKHHNTIATIEGAAKRLSRLNQALLLLAKIEGGRFELNQIVDWSKLINERADELKELITAKDLQFSIKTTAVSTVFHEHLADIIVTNLLSNAIRYNIPGGIIEVFLKNAALVISNTAALPKLDEAKVFNRFYRHPETKAEGNGLGLSIVKQICILAGYSFSYNYKNGMHHFTVGLQPAEA